MIRKWMCIAAGFALVVALAAPMQAQDGGQQSYGQQNWNQSGMSNQSYDQAFGDYDQQDYDTDLDNDQQGMTSIGPYGQPGFGTGAGGGFGAGTGTGARDYNTVGAGGLASSAEYEQLGYGTYGQWGGQPYYGYTPGSPPQPYYYGQPPEGYNQPYGYVAPAPYGYQPGVSPQGITRFSGQVLHMSTVNVYGRDHVFATIKTSQGGIVVADLGPVSSVNQLNLKIGDTVQAAGFQSMFNQSPVLVTTRVRANNKTITNRPEVQLHGRIVQTTTRTVSGESHVFATVDLDNGHRVTVDFGPRRYLQDNKIRFRANEEVSFLARSVREGNQTVYQARSINIAGRRITVPSSTRGRSEEAREATRGSFLVE